MVVASAAQQQPEGTSKLAAARAWAIPVVRLDWLEASKLQGRLLPAAPYLVQMPTQGADADVNEPLPAQSCVQSSRLSAAPSALSVAASSAPVQPAPNASPAQAARPRRQLSRLRKAGYADEHPYVPREIEVVRKASLTEQPSWAAADASPEPASASQPAASFDAGHLSPGLERLSLGSPSLPLDVATTEQPPATPTSATASARGGTGAACPALPARTERHGLRAVYAALSASPQMETRVARKLKPPKNATARQGQGSCLHTTACAKPALLAGSTTAWSRRPTTRSWRSSTGPMRRATASASKSRPTAPLCTTTTVQLGSTCWATQVQ